MISHYHNNNGGAVWVKFKVLYRLSLRIMLFETQTYHMALQVGQIYISSQLPTQSINLFLFGSLTEKEEYRTWNVQFAREK